MISAVGKVPTELLVEIFSLAIQSDSETSTVLQRNPPFGPHHPVHRAFLLSQICSSWRQIVIGSPKLWAIGLVDDWLRTENPQEDYLDLLKTLLDRSSPLPISVSVTDKTHSIVPLATSTKAILRVLVPTVTRWKKLKIDSGSVEVFKLISREGVDQENNVSVQHCSWPCSWAARSFAI
ncbi:hypothetical protein B0H13DRAFT_1722224 [Mycena leptocephala]|nr:hypothetical protein B0H13DRAFT_1722224 [Mycena leptocephala]